MIRRSIRLKSEIRTQAKVLELQRRVVGISYNRLKAPYRGRYWLKLGRVIVSPALLYILRTGAARWMHRAGL